MPASQAHEEANCTSHTYLTRVDVLISQGLRDFFDLKRAQNHVELSQELSTTV